MAHTPWHTISEEYRSGGDTTWKDVARDLDIHIPQEHRRFLWEYDPYQEEAIKGAAYGDIEGQYSDAMTQMMKARQPSKAGGSFAGTGSSLLDMTTKDMYSDIGRGTSGTLMGMMADITGERKEYRDDITDRFMDIQTMMGDDEFESYKETNARGTRRTTESGETEYWLGGSWVSQRVWDEFIEAQSDYDDYQD